jgi:polyisoprenoid-binding protein YceI
VRWRDIDTQNGTRNRHMLKTVEEERYPAIRFDLTRVVPESTAGDTLRVRLIGTLTLHGASQPVEWPAAVRAAPDTVTAAADFPVDMRDYGIKPPVRFVIARMGAVVTVHVRLVFVRDGAP